MALTLYVYIVMQHHANTKQRNNTLFSPAQNAV